MPLNQYRVTLIDPDGQAEESFEKCWADKRGTIAAVPEEHDIPDWAGPGAEVVAAKDGSVVTAFTVTDSTGDTDLHMPGQWRVFAGPQ